jgi:antitoxin (DNA-binding transcriptional repressor) of toxin-antitoxin stability system
VLPLSEAGLYNVHMARFTASQARQNFARVLDQAAGGQPVTIERGRLRFRLVLEERRGALRTARPVIEILDPAVANGDWTWRTGRAGLSFKRRTKT